MTNIFIAVYEDNLDEIRKIHAQDQIDINALSIHGESALTIAINRRNLQAVKLLLEFEGIDLNQETYVKVGQSLYPANPLFLSAKLNEPDIVKELLAKGADPTKQLGVHRAYSSNGSSLQRV